MGFSEALMAPCGVAANQNTNVRIVNSVQKDAFLDRRLNTEAFLLSLEEND